MASGSRVHAIAEGGLLAALSALVQLVGRVLPAGGLLFHIAGCLPVLRVTARHGRRAGAGMSAVVALILATVFGPLAGWGAFLWLMAFAVPLGFARRRGWGVVAAVAAATAAGALAVSVTLVESFLITGIQPIAAARVQLELALAAVVAVLPRVYGLLGVGAGLQAWVAGWIALVRTWLPTLSVLAMAGFAIAYGLGFSSLLFAADVAIGRRMGDPIPRLPRLVAWGLGVAGRMLAAVGVRTGQR